MAAYDFGFGATFLDYDNDGYQDLYWLGSTVNRGEGPGGQVFPSAGRMLRNNGGGGFEDITVRARLLDIARVNYDGLEHDQAARENPVLLRVRRIDPSLHENGKAVAHADLNADGYTDLIATNSSGEVFSGPFDPNRRRPPNPACPRPPIRLAQRRRRKQLAHPAPQGPNGDRRQQAATQTPSALAPTSQPALATQSIRKSKKSSPAPATYLWTRLT